MYRKLRSIFQRPVWLTAGSARPHVAPDEIVDEPEEELPREAPDVSHVTHPEPTHTPHDEAIELVSRKIEVLGSRADRVERIVEALSPVKVSELPSRAEYLAIAERVEANRKRGEELSRQLADLIESHSRTMHGQEEDRASITALKASTTRTDERLRDLAEEVGDLRQTTAGFSALIEGLRDELERRAARQTSMATRQLASVYTLAVVALLASLVAVVLLIVK